MKVKIALFCILLSPSVLCMEKQGPMSPRGPVSPREEVMQDPAFQEKVRRLSEGQPKSPGLSRVKRQLSQEQLKPLPTVFQRDGQ